MIKNFHWPYSLFVKYDIILIRNLERLLPKRLIERFYGPYQWTDDTQMTYHKLLKS